MSNFADIYRTCREPVDLDALLRAMRGRHSSNPIDKVCAIAFPFQKRRFDNFDNITFPIYDSNTPVSVAWERLISSIASAKMNHDELVGSGRGDTVILLRTPTIQLLCLFPHPSRHHWFPSWAQVQQYPDVSVRDNDPDPVAGDMDYSLRIMSGRIYRGCSLELKQPPTSEGKAVYNCSMGMDSKCVELVATVAGIELDIDSRSTYVLVDISPDHSLWPSLSHHSLWSEEETVCWGEGGHVHPPIWRESVIIVCEEVDNLADTQPGQVTTGSPAILRYRLRRITTLKWDCDLSNGPDFDPDFYQDFDSDYRWLLFKPSLEHMRSIVCRAGEGPHGRFVTFLCPPGVFCGPAAVAGLPIKNGRYEWDKCPVYEVYLV